MCSPASSYLGSSLRRAACFALLLPALSPLVSLAQNASAPAVKPHAATAATAATAANAATADAADPTASTAPLLYPSLAPQNAREEAAPSPNAWREAHDAVATFPRGHADIVAWEARQAGASAPVADAAAPSRSATSKPTHQGGHSANDHAHGKPHGKHQQHHQPAAGSKP